MRGFCSLDSFHDLRISNLDLFIEIGLSEFPIGFGLIYNRINYLSLKGKHGTALFALYQTLKIS